MKTKKRLSGHSSLLILRIKAEGKNLPRWFIYYDINLRTQGHTLRIHDSTPLSDEKLDLKHLKRLRFFAREEAYLRRQVILNS